MRVLVYDVETTTIDNGNPFRKENKVCTAGFLSDEYSAIVDVEYSGLPPGDSIYAWKDWFKDYNLLVGFNLKFDIHWARRYGIEWTGRVWDCQLVHFILTNQQYPFPSLNDVCTYYGLPLKLDVVKTEYWEKGLDTTDVPYDILCEYLTMDLELTKKVYELQKKEVEERGLNKLVSLANQDLLVLEEMEWNGMLYDKEASLSKGRELQIELDTMDAKLFNLVPFDFINWNSNDHLSAILFGGVIKYDVREANGTFKTGIKTGQIKYKVHHLEKQFERLVDPVKGSELAKEGYWSTSEDKLKQLKATGIAKEIINIILTRSKIDKVVGTYYNGLPKMIDENGWDDNIIHGQFNQCVAITGRLSSSKPNKQNIEGNVKDMFISRYKE